VHFTSLVEENGRIIDKFGQMQNMLVSGNGDGVDLEDSNFRDFLYKY